MGGHVARDPRVGVVPPDAAHLGGLLEHEPVPDTRLLKRVHHRQAGESCADDRDPHVTQIALAIALAVCLAPVRKPGCASARLASQHLGCRHQPLR